MNDLAKQARQGSIAAIIQILNEQLADMGVRTRAVFAEGVLQILCEAATVEQLEQPQLVVRVQQILEEIAPFGLKRVKVNSRLVREQQMLWLEEISRDPENQLLWSEEIKLRKPNIFLRLRQSMEMYQADGLKQEDWSKTNVVPPVNQHSFWPGLLGGISLGLLLIAGGWLFYMGYPLSNPLKLASDQVKKTTHQSTTEVVNQQTQDSQAQADPFAQAVGLATQAWEKGKTAQTSAQWLDIAAKWELASDLMAQVSPQDQRYQTAQDRVTSYRRNSQFAQQQAQANRSQSP